MESILSTGMPMPLSFTENRKSYTGICFLDGYDDDADYFLLGKFNSIADEVDQYLGKSNGVARQCIGDLFLNIDAE